MAGRHLDDDCKLEFYEPERSPTGKLIGKIPRSELNQNISKWSNTLVGYVRCG